MAWIAATAAAVAGIAGLIAVIDAEPPRLTVALERAACRMGPAPRDAAHFQATVAAGKVVVRYRATLSPAEVARIRAIARRLDDAAVAVPGAPSVPDVVEATAERRRLGCRRLDQRTEDALVQFARSVHGER